jgi:Protein of unknown function (DUF4058)
MVLHDHFRPPLSVRRHWHAFHNAWATYIASDLNAQLPEGYFAEPNVQFGIEIDVAAFEESPQTAPHEASQGSIVAHPLTGTGGAWAPPVPAHTIPFLLVGDTVEVMVFNSDAGIILAGAIELVSPANKDRPAHRSAFVSKCETYLQQGVGLVVVDVVTGRSANLHDALLARLAAPTALSLHAELYAVAYRPVERHGQPSLDIWQKTLVVGHALPPMPLWLRGALCVQVALEATYERTCREQRITVNGV